MLKTRYIIGCIVLGVLAIAFFAPPVTKVYDSPGWLRSANRIKQIGWAIYDYHEAFGKLPPAVVYSKDGKPLYSWRVLVLPYLEQEPFFKLFKLDEPWDSEHNRKLLEMPSADCYVPWGGGINDAPGFTRYQVLVGPGTAFERPGLTFKDFSDGLSNTLLVVEAAEPVPWSKPADLSYDPTGPLPRMLSEFTKPARFFWRETLHSGFHAAFPDGECRFIRSDTDEKLIRALITRNGGEKMTRADLP